MRVRQWAVLGVVIAIHGCLLWVLNQRGQGVQGHTRVMSERVTVLTLIPLRPAVEPVQRQERAVARSPKIADGAGRVGVPRSRRLEMEPQAISVVPGDVTVDPVQDRKGTEVQAQQTAAAEPAASQPLRLDAKVIRQAAAAAMTPTGRMLGDAQERNGGVGITEGEKFGRAVASSAKPDCLKGDRSKDGATGLLALPSVIRDVLKGDCR